MLVDVTNDKSFHFITKLVFSTAVNKRSENPNSLNHNACRKKKKRWQVLINHR